MNYIKKLLCLAGSPFKMYEFFGYKESREKFLDTRINKETKKCSISPKIIENNWNLQQLKVQQKNYKHRITTWIIEQSKVREKIDGWEDLRAWEGITQPCMRDKARFARYCSLIKDHNIVDFNTFPMDSSNKRCSNMSLKYECNRYKCSPWAEGCAIFLDKNWCDLVEKMVIGEVLLLWNRVVAITRMIAWAKWLLLKMILRTHVWKVVVVVMKMVSVLLWWKIDLFVCHMKSFVIILWKGGRHGTYS